MRRTPRLSPEHRDELRALALGQPADGLARRDAALGEDLVGLHAAVLGNGEQHVEHLRRLDVLGWVEQQLVDRNAAPLEVALELRAPSANVVSAPQRVE